MHVAGTTVLLLLLTAGCAHFKSDGPVPEPPNVASQPGKPPPAARPAAPAATPPAPAKRSQRAQKPRRWT